MESKSSLAQLTGCALALAALTAAAALLIFALVFAGLVRPDWTTAPGGLADLLPGRAAPATAVDATATPGVTSVATPTIAVGGASVATPAGAGAPAATGTPLGGRAAPGRAVATAGTRAAPTRGTPTAPAPAFTPDTPAPPGGGAPAAARPSRTTATLVVEDWTPYDGDADLAGAYSVNLGWADNTLDLALLGADEGPGGLEGMVASYGITAPAPNDYVGFERDLDAMSDWSSYTHLVLRATAEPRGPGRLVVQWYEATGEVWTHAVPLADLPADGVLMIPLTADAWTWAEWSDKRNQKMDPQMATRYGVFIGHAGPAAGTVTFGPLEVVRVAE